MPLFGPNIARMKARRDLDGLVRVLGHGNPQLREAAAGALAELGGQPVIAALTAALGSQDQVLRKNAQEALIRIGEAALPHLTKTVKTHPDGTVRIWASYALGAIVRSTGDASLVDELPSTWIECMDDPENNVRYNVAYALNDALQRFADLGFGTLNGTVAREAAPGFIPLLADPDPDTRGLALRAMTWVLPALSDSSSREQAVAHLIAFLPDNKLYKDTEAPLGQLGTPAVKALLGKLDDPDDVIRIRASFLLGGLLDAQADAPLAALSLDRMIRALGDKHCTVRVNALYALVRIVPHLTAAARRQIVPQLIACLDDPDAQVRRNVCLLLGDWELEDDLPAVADALRRVLVDSDEGVRQAAKQALLRIGAPAREGLLQDLRDDSWLIRKAAFDVVIEIGGEEAFAVLEETLHNPQYGLSMAALERLGQTGDPRAVDLLLPLLDGIGGELRTAAVRALKQLNWTPARDVRGVAFWIEQGDWRRAAGIGEPALPALLGQYAHTRNLELADSLGELAISAQNPDLVVQVVDRLVSDVQIGTLQERRQKANTLARIARGRKLPEAARAKILSRRQEIEQPHTDRSQHKDFPHWDKSSYAPANDCSDSGTSAHEDYVVTRPGALYTDHVNRQVHTDRGIGVELYL